MNTKIVRLAGLVVLLALLLAGALYFSGRVSGWNQLQPKVTEALAADSRNSGITVKVSRGSGNLYFDLAEVSGDKSSADVFRTFLTASQALKEESFDKVILTRHGQQRFWIPGSYWHELAASYGTDNVIYTVRTFPEHVMKPDGSGAFQKWEGGFLGVATKQMEDFNDFMKQWVAE